MLNFKNNKHGDINYNGTIIHLTQGAYLSGTNEQSFYEAHAKDDNDNEYIVRWEITHENPEECDDESDMCNWNNYTVTAA